MIWPPRPILRKITRLPALLAVALLTWGHVGSPDVFFEGKAGPYPVRIVVRPPLVVPGRAEINVRTLAPGVSRVSVQPVVWNAGPEGAPPADRAQPVRGDARQWSAQLWLMRPTSYSVRVEVGGAAGTGTVLVPVVAVATRRLPMQRGMGLLLAGLGLFLLVGALTAIGAAVRESALPPGEEPDPGRRRRARRVMAGTALLLGLALWGGRVWWRSVDRDFARTIFRPFHLTASTRAAGGERRLTVAIDESTGGSRDWVPLMPDHGKLMHLFLVRQPGLDAFAHLHPVPLGPDGTFETPLPPLPDGPYHLYADVTHENGFSETLTTTVELPAAETTTATPSGAPDADPDDSFRLGAAAAASGGTADLGDGFTMTWDGPPGPRVAGAEAGLRFAVHGPGGTPAVIEPYMGMLSHAAVVRDDRGDPKGTVFIHLHPEGTVSMAALQFFQSQQGGSGNGMAGMSMGAMHPGVPGLPGDGVLSFPWSFPRPGRYHLWVQVKTGGPVRTGVFAVEVAAGRNSNTENG
ncbi:MAG TPA: hypothetical protein VFE33_18560 [Thermoanaerobaculia bacterium]|nr:hypothetical protein [Thermoanaerobaculia bacterium]